MSAPQNENTKPDPEIAPRSGFFSLSINAKPIVYALALIACVPSWLMLISRWNWRIELTSHFVWQYAVAMPVVMLIAWRAGWRRLLLLATASLLINVSRLAPLYVPVPTPAAAEQPASLRVLSLNVLTGNRRFEDVLNHIRSADADLVVLLEVDAEWIEAMRPLESIYPTSESITRWDNFGVAFYSRVPVSEVEFREFGGAEVPSVVAELEALGGLITLIGTHPLPPSSAEFAELRNRQLAAIGAFAREQAGSVIVAGDLNSSPFSPYFRDLLKAGELVDSGRGRGYRATWYSGFDFAAIPIDHILHTTDLVVRGREVGPGVGSDHRSVLVDFSRR